MSDATAVIAPRRRPGRPATGQRNAAVVQVTFDDDEQAIIDALLALRGKTRGRATLLRDLMLREARQAGIPVPGPTKQVEVTAA